jgi:hypothetical protein
VIQFSVWIKSLLSRQFQAALSKLKRDGNPLEMATVAKLGPENSTRVSDHSKGEGSLCRRYSTSRANCTKQKHLLETSRLIRWLGIATEFGVGYEDLTGESGRGECALKPGH